MKHSSVTRSMVNPDYCTFQNVDIQCPCPQQGCFSKNHHPSSWTDRSDPKTHSSRFCLTATISNPTPWCKSPSAADAVGDLQIFVFPWKKCGPGFCGAGQHPAKNPVHTSRIISIISKGFWRLKFVSSTVSFGMDPEATLNMVPTQKSIQELTLMVV